MSQDLFIDISQKSINVGAQGLRLFHELRQGFTLLNLPTLNLFDFLDLLDFFRPSNFLTL